MSDQLNKSTEILESINDGFFTLDKDWRFTYINRRAASNLGFTPADLVGKVLWEKFPAVIGTEYEVSYREAMTERQPQEFEIQGIYSSAWYFIRIYPSREGISVYWQDITDRKKAEEALKTNIERLKILSDSSSLLLSGENPEKIVQTIADNVMAHLGCDCFFNFIVDEKANKLKLNAYAGITEDVARGIEWLSFGEAICGCAARDGCRIVSENIRENGDMRAALVRSFGIQAYAAHPLKIGSKTIGTLSFGTRSRTSFTGDELDLMRTIAGQVSVAMERKRAEESLRQYTSELETANKELEAFSYSVSHDLRQPLRALDGFSQLVMEDYGDKLDEEGRDYLNRVRKASQYMSELIDDILKLSRITRADLFHDDVNLSILTRAILEELNAHEPERDAVFIIPGDITVNGDQQLLAIAFRNLLENAWKFTRKCPQTRIELGVKQIEGEKVYFIKDNGTGIPMEYADKLFQPFQQLHTNREDYEGTGIGLAIVQRIIRRHNGKIWVESQKGEGSVFYFTLG